MTAIKHDRMIYFVLVDYGPRLGMAWAERPIERTGFADTMQDILNGQLGQVVQVIELNHVEFTSRDVTEDFQRTQAVYPEIRSKVFAQLADLDHARDHRKHEEMV